MANGVSIVNMAVDKMPNESVHLPPNLSAIRAPGT